MKVYASSGITNLCWIALCSIFCARNCTKRAEKKLAQEGMADVQVSCTIYLFLDRVSGILVERKLPNNKGKKGKGIV